ncbi:MAG: hypothetical protein QOI20_2169 [Acidimicrobiaceae bacterium]|nr:hypothetical protein [Acidimicrobiaceae bacterium]
MDTQCAECGARLFEGADWCTQCFTPIGRAHAQATPTPRFSTAAGAVEKLEGGPVTTLAAPARAVPWYEQQPVDSAPPPPAPPSEPPGLSPPVPLPVGSRRVEVDGSVFRTGIAMVALGAATTLVMAVWGATSHTETATVLRVGLYVNVALYVLVLDRVVKRARQISFNPIWTRGDEMESLFVGLLVGGGLATLLLMWSKATTGRVAVDDGINLIVSEGTVIRIGLAFLLACVAAPWVEELLFRGLLAESLQPWGALPAAACSAVMFAVWHPQALFPLVAGLFGGHSKDFAPFIYYVICGLVLAAVYLARGLKASIAAHTAFNGLIVVMAVAVASGPAQTITAHGIAVKVPGSWRVVPLAQADAKLAKSPAANMIDMTVQGPSGAGLMVMHLPVPQGVVLSADAVAANVASSATASMGFEVSETQRVDYPMGQAVRMKAKIAGHAGALVLVPADGRLWMIMLMSGGSARATRDFDGILQRLRLPTPQTGVGNA